MSTFKGLGLAGAAVLVAMGFAKAADPAPVYFAAPPMGWDGYVGAAAGQLSADAGGGAGVETLPRQQVRGSAAVMLTPDFGLQVDAQGNLVSNDTSSVGAAEAALHLFARQSGRLFGAFVQARGVATGTGPLITGLFAGGEVQWMQGQIMLYGQAAWQQFAAGTLGGNLTGFVGALQGSFFITQNWRLDGSVVYDRVSLAGTSVANTFLTIGTEFRFNNPVSVFANYSAFNVSASGTSISGSVFLIGGRLNIGAPTLMARAQNGASLQPAGLGVCGFVLYIC